MAWRKPMLPPVLLVDTGGFIHTGEEVRFLAETTGHLWWRQTTEVAYLRNTCGDWRRIGPIREMRFR